MGKLILIWFLFDEIYQIGLVTVINYNENYKDNLKSSLRKYLTLIQTSESEI